jgi:hypothetical protein
MELYTYAEHSVILFPATKRRERNIGAVLDEVELLPAEILHPLTSE